MPSKRKSRAAAGSTETAASSIAKRTRTATSTVAAVNASPSPQPPRDKNGIKYKPAELCSYVAKVVEHAEGLEYSFMQRKTCQRWNSSKLNDQCLSCIEKQASCGTCRFLGMRVFREEVDESGTTRVNYTDYAFIANQDDPIEPVRQIRARKRTEQRVKSTGLRRSAASGSESEELEEKKAPRNNTYPTPILADPLVPSLEDAEYALPIIAEVFACHMRRERWHEKAHVAKLESFPGGPRPLLRILCTPLTRSLCDVCSTSIYMGSYLCGCCGRELCLGCWEEWTPSDKLVSGRLHRIDQCSRKRRHSRESMLFVTRAKPGEISELMEKVMERITKVKEATSPLDDDKVIESIPKTTASYPADDGPYYLPVPRVKHDELPLDKFQCLWRRGGIPLVLTGMLEKFQLPWDAQYFIDEHGVETCQIHDCKDGSVHDATVAEFFSKFSSSSASSHKLKDWPPAADFRDTFPVLFADFENAIPYPSYTRRSGPLNLASHFQEGWVAPDLGPKMYNAYPAPDFLPVNEDALTPKQKLKRQVEIAGTTNLHLDLTDAVNIMLFASGGLDAPLLSTTEKGIPICGAIWDIFPPESAGTIRAYLKGRAEDVDDPIHRQLYYLSEFDLIQLRKKGVGSYRVFQQPGDAVFIPAGCPHQVRNRRSCVKVAVDFLSAENVGVCRRLIEEARKMAPKVPKPGNKGTAKEDVLQLWACLGFAWTTFSPLLEKSTDNGH